MSKSCLLISYLYNQEKNKKFYVINNISEALNYLDKGKLSLISSDKIKSELHKTLIRLIFLIIIFLIGLKRINLTKKNNNIIIEFADNEGKALLFMNTTEDLKNLDINNIFIIDFFKLRKNHFKLALFNDILKCNNIKEIFDQIEGVIFIPAINLIKNTSPKKKILNSGCNNNSNCNNNSPNKYAPPINKENKNILIEMKNDAVIKLEKKSKQINSITRQKSLPNKDVINMNIESFQISKNEINTKQNFNIFKNKAIQQKFSKPKIFSFINNQQKSNNKSKIEANLNNNKINNNVNNDINQNTNNNINNNVNIKKKNKIIMMQGAIINKENNIIIKKDPKNNDNIPEVNLDKITKLNNIYKQENEKQKDENSRLNISEQELQILKDSLNRNKEESEEIKLNNQLLFEKNKLKKSDDNLKESLKGEFNKKDINKFIYFIRFII